MKPKKEKSIVKSVRIPLSLDEKIRTEIKQTGKNYNEYVVDSISTNNRSINPATMVRLQNVINMVNKTASPDMAESIQKEMNYIWESLK